MRFSTFRAATVGALLLPFAAACSSGAKFPASPVPAPLTDMEAARIADTYVVPKVGTGRTTTSLRAMDTGWLVGYTTDIYPDARPPKESRLVVVNHDGTVREILFRANK